MDGCALGLGPVSVGGTFDVPSAHLAPDNSGAAAENVMRAVHTLADVVTESDDEATTAA